MYKNNSRDSIKFKGCSPLQLSCNMTGKCHAVGYYSYTYRWGRNGYSENKMQDCFCIWKHFCIFIRYKQ